MTALNLFFSWLALSPLLALACGRTMAVCGRVDYTGVVVGARLECAA
jgi:hypothetical protein